MAHFNDLSPYEYGGRSAGPEPGTSNIGWLSKAQPFPSGEAPAEFVRALNALVEHPVNLYRGSHVCEFCCRALGNGEIRVTGDGTVFVAPVLVAHYVAEHHYLPPQAFIDAVLKLQSAETETP